MSPLSLLKTMRNHRLMQIRPATTFVALFFLCMSPSVIAAAKSELTTNVLSDPFYLLFFLIGISLLPFLAIMVTSFAKIVVVLSIARQAIGTAQTPPNIVIISLSMILTVFSMYPVIKTIEDDVGSMSFAEAKTRESLEKIFAASKEPIREFLYKHAQEKDRELFLSLLNRNALDHQKASSKDFIVLAPAFLISELSHAFQIGFLVYLPFLVIDMLVANLLMALGMQMLAPTTISLPFKILLFVLVDGWRLLAEGLAKV